MRAQVGEVEQMDNVRALLQNLRVPGHPQLQPLPQPVPAEQDQLPAPDELVRPRLVWVVCSIAQAWNRAALQGQAGCSSPGGAGWRLDMCGAELQPPSRVWSLTTSGLHQSSAVVQLPAACALLSKGTSPSARPLLAELPEHRR